MAESETQNKEERKISLAEIPIEIVSEEEMAFIETALALATASFATVARSPPKPTAGLHSIAKRRISVCTGVSLKKDEVVDVEDLGGGTRKTKKKIGAGNESLLDRFRRKKGMSVTDFTATEWCEKQMEHVLLLGRQKPSKAMRAGQARHAELEEEIVKRVKVDVKSVEDTWALRFMNFIVGAQQLMFEGLTRELPVIGCVEGVWVVGIIDEVRISLGGTASDPVLVDTKTRTRDSLPAEPQRRNGRFQLMCYKSLWDNQIINEFPSKYFIDFFSLNPHLVLSEHIQEVAANSGYEAKTLDDVLRSFGTMCSMLSPAQDKLLLRYEFQENKSLILEDSFDYDQGWLTSNIQQCLEFWKGEREANYVPEEELWKCRFCRFSSICWSNNNGSPSSPQASQLSQPDNSDPANDSDAQ